MARTYLILGSIFAFLGVAFGAFGAHALKTRIEPSLLEAFQTGVQYQAIHALALIMAAVLWYFKPNLVQLKTVCFFFAAGIIFFSGSLYVMALTGVKLLGAITPVGGVNFLMGWVYLTVVAVSLPANQSSS